MRWRSAEADTPVTQRSEAMHNWKVCVRATLATAPIVSERLPCGNTAQRRDSQSKVPRSDGSIHILEPSMLHCIADSDATKGPSACAEGTVRPSARIPREGTVNSRNALLSILRAQLGWRVGRRLMLLVAVLAVPAIAQRVDDQHAARMAEVSNCSDRKFGHC